MEIFSSVIALDHWVSQQVLQCHSAMGDLIFFCITSMGDPTSVIVFTAVLTLFWVGRKKYALLLLMVTAVLGSFLSMSLIKILVQRPRPDIEGWLYVTGYSFPSGHSAVSMALYGILAYFIGRALQGGGKKKWVYGLAGLLIFAIGFSRIYWGVHYLSDVLCGWTLGALWLWFTIGWLDKRIAQRLP